jgi:hypothetical protein
MTISCVSQECYVPHPADFPPWFGHVNNVQRRVQLKFVFRLNYDSYFLYGAGSHFTWKPMFWKTSRTFSPAYVLLVVWWLSTRWSGCSSYPCVIHEDSTTRKTWLQRKHVRSSINAFRFVFVQFFSLFYIHDDTKRTFLSEMGRSWPFEVLGSSK